MDKVSCVYEVPETILCTVNSFLMMLSLSEQTHAENDLTTCDTVLSLADELSRDKHHPPFGCSV